MRLTTNKIGNKIMRLARNRANIDNSRSIGGDVGSSIGENPIFAGLPKKFWAVPPQTIVNQFLHARATRGDIGDSATVPAMSSRKFPVLDFLRRREIFFFMYPTTVLLSVQYVSFTSLHSSSLRKTHPILEAQTAAVSSSLGMVTDFNGATRDLPITSEQ